MIRGYSIAQQFNYLETQYDPETSSRLISSIPTQVVEDIKNIRPADWYPRMHSVHVLRAIAARRPDDEESAYNDLVRCGTFIVTEATNTFLKLLMKILTPTLFAKKIPEFWKRDQQGGRFEVDTSDAKNGNLHLQLCDVAGFDHIAVIGVGWISYGLKAMGKDDVQVKQTGWGLETPGPENISYHVTWT
jgi:hypothetical protein